MQPILLALLAALLFGASTPASKVLLSEIGPFALAGLLYLGAALGTAPLALRDRAGKPALGPRTRDVRALALAVVCGLGYYSIFRDPLDSFQVKIGGDGCQRAIVPRTAMGCH